MVRTNPRAWRWVVAIVLISAVTSFTGISTATRFFGENSVVGVWECDTDSEWGPVTIRLEIDAKTIGMTIRDQRELVTNRNTAIRERFSYTLQDDRLLSDAFGSSDGGQRFRFNGRSLILISKEGDAEFHRVR